ncbi:MAG TPA: hypothetical protein VLE47_03740 [Candidatus Saccharimonadales bacterium]|nr:hypothetical protein [Candidatus Saccharimonadales bacterium]
MITKRDLEEWGRQERINITHVGTASIGSILCQEIKVVCVEGQLIHLKIKVFDINEEEGVQLRLQI